ncbi:MAG: hypothetical protein IJD92_00245 [Bacilli bacterium]|nr:hypothetical protein [Bacilli bacterium]
MGNLMLKLKRFLGNRNTITIICVIAGVAVLLFGYNIRVNQAVQPISVPYALKRIEPKSKVESENVGTIKVSGAFVEQTTDLITSKSYILNNEWYVNYDTVIPEGGLFYKSQLVTKDELPDTAFDEIPDGATIFSLSVDSHSTYGNSIMPGNFIDLYLKAVDEQGKIIFGKFIESIKVLSVRDSGGNDVFADSDVSRTSGELLFAVKDDLFMLLSEAVFVGGIDIIPVPRNEAYRSEGDTENGTQVSKQELVDFILEKVSELSDDIDLSNDIVNNNYNSVE